ncbi:MAG: hypothetical protein OXC80_08080 [Gammaproteobacteria bacterium]|nr:hypothetical protein [Gammaproteobacteria bacterium]
MSTARWDLLRYQSPVNWGEAPVPLIPSTLRAKFGEEDAPLSDELLTEFHLCVRDLDTTFWQRNISLSATDLGQLLRWIENKLSSVANEMLLHKMNAKRVEIHSLALPTQQLDVLRRILDAKYIDGSEVQFEKLLTRFEFEYQSIAKLACLLEAAQPHPLDTQFVSRAGDSRTTAGQISHFVESGARLTGNRSEATASRDTQPGAPSTQYDLRSSVTSSLYPYADLGLDLAAVLEMIRSLRDSAKDRRIIDVLMTRTLVTSGRKSMSDISKQFNITDDRTRQLDIDARNLIYRTRSSKHSLLVKVADVLKKRLGSAVPANSQHLHNEMTLAIDDTDDPSLHKFARLVLLSLAGPFVERQGWLISDRKLWLKTPVAVEKKVATNGYLRPEDLARTLNDLGIREQFHREWLNSFDELVPVEEGEDKGGYLYCAGEFLDRIHTLMSYYPRPFSTDEIVQKLGKRNTRGIRFRMLNDKRFWRINKQADFVLANAPGHRQYRGITIEIENEIKESGGMSTVDEIVNKLHETFGVTPNSVLAYVRTQYFTIDPDTKRVSKNEKSDQPFHKSLADTGKCFYVNGQWTWRITVNADWLRGSGRTCPDGFALELGCAAGGMKRVPSDYGDIAVAWKLNSPSGAHIGSLKKVIDDMNLDTGDHLFVRKIGEKIDFYPLLATTVEQKATRFEKAALLVGFQSSEDITSMDWGKLGGAIGLNDENVDEDTIYQRLVKRTDREVAALWREDEVIPL